MSRIIVIGGGPAGMMAAGTAAAHGAIVTLLEKNEKLGKKLYITGKGRCNLTNDTDIPGLMASIMTNPRFLHSAFYAMDSTALMAFFEGQGVSLKTERGGRVFPVSDYSGDINDAMKAYLRVTGVQVELNTAVQSISLFPDISGSARNIVTPSKDDETPKQARGDVKCDNVGGGEVINNGNHVPFVIKTSRATYHADAVIVATGGLSYPSTGSTGDGFAWAKSLGHAVIPTHPSLVPMHAPEPWIAGLTGLSLKNVRCIASISNTVIYEEIGEMMFTPNGITGPLILKASAHLAGKWEQKPIIAIDLKPGLTTDQLDTRILRDFSASQNKDFANALDGLLPQRLIETIISLSNIPPHKKVHTITRAERQSLVHLLKNLTICPTGNAGYKEAVITKGGVSTKEVNPSTLMSKHIPGLFFAGEILDVDALTGGYNMQIAFSTGYLAGLSAAEYINLGV